MHPLVDTSLIEHCESGIEARAKKTLSSAEEGYRGKILSVLER